MAGETFIPIFFSPGWILEKYHGWFCIHEEPGVRVIRKKVGLFYKTLFMSQGVGDERLSSLMCDRRFTNPLGIDILHDFSRAADDRGLTLGRRRFRPHSKRQMCKYWYFCHRSRRKRRRSVEEFCSEYQN